MHLMTGKADFSHTYTQQLPDAYFAALAPYGYTAPEGIIPYLDSLVTWCKSQGYSSPLAILEVGASYGITSMLLRTGRSFDELAWRFCDPQRAGQSTTENLASDRAFFDRFPVTHPVTGLDASSAALRYAKTVGLLSDTVPCNPNADAVPPLRFAGAVAVISSGTLGYITPDGLNAVLRAIDAPVIFGVLILSRTLGVDSFGEACTRNTSLTVRESSVSLRQRRFVHEQEQRAAMALVAERRPGSALLEEDGWVYASPLIFASAPGLAWLAQVR